MTTGVHINGDQLLLLQEDVANLAVSIGEIADGAYVTETLFTRSMGKPTIAMDGLLHALVEAASAMQACANKLAHYLDRVFIEYEATDLALASHVNLSETALTSDHEV